MLNYQNFQNQFELVELNFNFKYPAKLLMLVFEKLKGLSQDEFDKGINKILAISAENWNKKYGFGGKPAIADWVNFFMEEKKQSPENQAIIQVAKILDYAKHYWGNDVIFDNEFTNETVQKSGGIAKIARDINPDNENPRPREWVVKDLKDMWLACYDGNQGSFRVCKGISQPDTFHNGEFVKRPNQLDYVGDKKSCLRLMNKIEDKGVNLPAQKKIDKLVGNVAKKLKTA
jgi:hypothetical protein